MSKNKLQEIAQRNYLSLPIYTSSKYGPDHAPQFRASVTYNGHIYHSPGYCRSVKQAETAAAEAALRQLSLESEKNPQKTNAPVSVQMGPCEVPSNSQKESKKEQKGDRKEETLQQAENVAPISKGGITNVLENSELKAETSQLTQSPHLPFPSSRIQVISVREFSKSENSGKATDKQNTVKTSSIPGISCNERNKEQAHRMAVGTMQEKQQTEDVIQQSKGITSTSEFISVKTGPVELPSNLQKESKIEQNGDREEETLQQAEDVSCISESGIANLLIKSELKAEKSQPAQTPCPQLNIHVMPFQGSSMSENSGGGTDKQNSSNISSIPETSCNETHREQAHKMTVGMIEERQWNKEINQQSKGMMSTPQFISDMHKNQLQEFAIKGGFDLPCYSSIREGPPHALRFKATVKFNGETYEGPGFFNTLRQAEHAAASVALKSLSEKGSSLDELSMYKNLLQGKAQKEGKPLPVYNTSRSGPPHMPVFTCIVKFDGMTFEGKCANTKKQAEKSAAAVAWSALENCKRSSFSTQQLHDHKVKELIYEPNDREQVHVQNYMKKEATQELHVQPSHLDISRNPSTVSHLPPSEAVSMGSKKEPLHNTTSVLGVKDEVQQPCNTSSLTKHSSGTRIRVLPDLSSSSKPWLAVNITGGTVQSQNNSS